MPVKQTRESIEAELNASKRERNRPSIAGTGQGSPSCGNDLRSLEDERHTEFARSRPLPERMAAVGMSRAMIDRVK